MSRIDAERRANPGYRAFLANGYNVTRSLVLFVWEVALEVSAAVRAARRDVRPRGHRGGAYPLMRAAMCVIVRDLIVFGVLTDMMRGRPAVYATFSSYDEVAHHSGLQRADTLEALRKLDQQFGRIASARAYAPRPYELVVLSDHGQTQGATFKQRNGYALDELVERSLAGGRVAALTGGDEQDAMVKTAVNEATGRTPGEAEEERRVRARGRRPGLREPGPRLPHGREGEAHPRGARGASPEAAAEPARASPCRLAARALRASTARSCSARAERGIWTRSDSRATTRWLLLAHRLKHLLRTDGFEHVADIMVGSFYDPALDEGCAFEELISFHGGLGGPQTQPSSCTRPRWSRRPSRSSGRPRFTRCSWAGAGHSPERTPRRRPQPRAPSSDRGDARPRPALQAESVDARPALPSRQLLAFEFGAGAAFEGQLVGALERLESGGALRILDALFVAADDAGELVGIDLQGSAGGLTAKLIEFRLDPAARRRAVQRSLGDEASEGAGRLLREVGEQLKPGSALAVLLIEHVWAGVLEDAVARAGGAPRASEFVEARQLSELAPETLGLLH